MFSAPAIPTYGHAVGISARHHQQQMNQQLMGLQNMGFGQMGQFGQTAGTHVSSNIVFITELQTDVNEALKGWDE
jgi:hypothetical protein